MFNNIFRIWVNLLTIVRNKVKEKVQQNNKGRESWKINETTQFEEFCMVCCKQNMLTISN